MVKNGKPPSTKKPTVASATDSENITIEVPAGKLHFENFREWLIKHGYADDEPSSDISTRPLFLTIFKDKTGSEKFKGEHTLPKWADIIRTTNADSKGKLPWLKGAVFGDKLSENGSFRTDKNLDLLTAIVVEHDKETISFDQAMSTISKAGLRCLGYTSPSYREDKQRWRLVFPLSRNCQKTEHDVLVAIVNGLFSGQLADDSWALSRAYYFGSINNNPAHRVEIVDGQFLDIARTGRLFAGRIFKDGGKEEPIARERNTGPKSVWEDINSYTREPIDKAEAQAALDNISSDCSYLDWWPIGAALWNTLGDDGEQLFIEWSKKCPDRYNEKEVAEKWKQLKHDNNDHGAGKLFGRANDENPNWREEFREQQDDGDEAGDDAPDDEQPNAPPPKDKKPKPPLITATPFVLRPTSAIPVREWLYGRHLIRKAASATVALGGVGKSSLIIVEALAMVTGRPLLGVTPTQCCKVWLWNGEDPLEEIERRIAAACLYFDIKAEELEDNLFVNSGHDSEIIIATQTGHGIKIAVPIVEALERTIIDNQIDVVSIDPFISSHRVTENDNNAIDIVAKIWTRLANTTNTAIDLVHHSRKTGGAEVTVEDTRGAGSMINAVRSSRVLNTMSKDEGTKAGVSSPRGYFRTDDGKMNLAPPADKAKWFHLESVELGNGPPHSPFEDGDKVAVVTQWEWPNPLDGVTGKDFEQAAYYIRQKKWRENSQAKDWVGYAVARALKLNVSEKADKGKIIGLLKIWIGTGALIVVDGEDEKRNTRKFVEVAED